MTESLPQLLSELEPVCRSSAYHFADESNGLS